MRDEYDFSEAVKNPYTDKTETQIMRNTKNFTNEEFKAMTPQEQLKEFKRLKKALELEKIRSEAYNHMIDLAEQQFKIPIRKKSETQQ